jgi:hypothetical protein
MDHWAPDRCWTGFTRKSEAGRATYSTSKKNILGKTLALELRRSDLVPYLIQVLEQALDCRSGTQRSTKNQQGGKVGQQKTVRVGIFLWQKIVEEKRADAKT